MCGAVIGRILGTVDHGANETRYRRQWIHSTLSVYLSFSKVVRWLYFHRAEGGTTAAIEEAAANGHVAVLDWLNRNTPLRASLETSMLKPSALDRAAANGYLGVIRFEE